MATFVVLMNWTEEGVKGFKDSTKRASAAEEGMREMGITLREIYWTIGAYDVVCVFEATSFQKVRTFRRTPWSHDAGDGTIGGAPALPSSQTAC